MSLAEQFVRQREEIKDPRPNLNEDSQLWQDFLIIAKAKYFRDDPEFWWTLHGFRCMGTRIVKGESGYLLRPLVDDRLGFQDGEYEEMRDKYLKPHVKRIKEVLDMLGQNERLKR